MSELLHWFNPQEENKDIKVGFSVLFLFLQFHLACLFISTVFSIFNRIAKGLFSDRNATGIGGRRYEWNRKLIMYGCGEVSARLVSYISHMSENKTGMLYKFWPSVRDLDSELLDTLPLSFYKNISSFTCIPCGPDKVLKKPSEVILIRKHRDEPKIRNALLSDGMSVPKPQLPENISKGFEIAGIPLQVLSPKQLRDELRINFDLNVSNENVEKSLQNKQWIAPLLSYCCLDEDLDDLYGVPLGMTSDGVLHTFGLNVNGDVYMADMDERTILSSAKHLFLDQDLQKI